MAAPVTKSQRAFIKVESTYGTEAGSSDGSDFTILRLTAPAGVTDEKQRLETNEHTGFITPTRFVAGPDGGSIALEGLVYAADAAASGSGSSVGTRDAFHLLMESFAGTATEREGEDLSGLGSAAIPAITVTGDTDMLFCFDDDSTGLCHWARSFEEDVVNNYRIVPSLPSSPQSADTTVAHREFAQDDVSGTQGTNSFSMVIENQDVDGTLRYLYTGCRVSAFSITAEVGQLIRWSATVMYNEALEDTATKSALPSQSGSCDFRPIVQLNSPVYFDSTEVAGVGAVTIDFNLDAQPVQDMNTATGRQDYMVYSNGPTVTVNPLLKDLWRDEFRSQVTGSLMVQLGGGEDVSSQRATACMSLTNAQVSAYAESDDSNKRRNDLTFMTHHPCVISGTINGQYQPRPWVFGIV